MPTYVSILFLAALSSTALCGIAQQTTPQIKQVPIQQTSAVSGQEMYKTYCAVCHGVDGRGNGPAVPALKVPPGDLTTLSLRNGGTYPWARVQATLTFGAGTTPAHGSAEMPVWGHLLTTLHPSGRDSAMLTLQRIHNLSNYMKQIQQTAQ